MLLRKRKKKCLKRGRRKEEKEGEETVECVLHVLLQPKPHFLLCNHKSGFFVNSSPGLRGNCFGSGSLKYVADGSVALRAGCRLICLSN